MAELGSTVDFGIPVYTPNLSGAESLISVAKTPSDIGELDRAIQIMQLRQGTRAEPVRPAPGGWNYLTGYPKVNESKGIASDYTGFSITKPDVVKTPEGLEVNVSEFSDLSSRARALMNLSRIDQNFKYNPPLSVVSSNAETVDTKKADVTVLQNPDGLLTSIDAAMNDPNTGIAFTRMLENRNVMSADTLNMAYVRAAADAGKTLKSESDVSEWVRKNPTDAAAVRTAWNMAQQADVLTIGELRNKLAEPVPLTPGIATATGNFTVNDVGKLEFDRNAIIRGGYGNATSLMTDIEPVVRASVEKNVFGGVGEDTTLEKLLPYAAKNEAAMQQVSALAGERAVNLARNEVGSVLNSKTYATFSNGRVDFTGDKPSAINTTGGAAEAASFVETFVDQKGVSSLTDGDVASGAKKWAAAEFVSRYGESGLSLAEMQRRYTDEMPGLIEDGRREINRAAAKLSNERADEKLANARDTALSSWDLTFGSTPDATAASVAGKLMIGDGASAQVKARAAVLTTEISALRTRYEAQISRAGSEAAVDQVTRDYEAAIASKIATFNAWLDTPESSWLGDVDKRTGKTSIDWAGTILPLVSIGLSVYGLTYGKKKDREDELAMLMELEQFKTNEQLRLAQGYYNIYNPTTTSGSSVTTTPRSYANTNIRLGAV